MSPRNIIKIFIFNIFILPCLSRVNLNISFSDLSLCKEYRIQSGGYTYKDFFQIEEMQIVKTDGEMFRLNFYVLTTKDAHILLSDKEFPKKDDNVYEIVIGAGSNTFSTIRPQIGKGRLAIVTKSEILSPIDPTPIEICQYLNGRVDVDIPGLASPYMTFVDKTPLHIKYVSFSSFGSTPAKWFYNCKDDEDDARMTIDTDNNDTKKQLTTDLFKNYNYIQPPTGLKLISFSFNIRGIRYDTKKSVLTTRMEIKMKWFDDRIYWDPAKYDNITSLSLSDYEFWTPTLVLGNGAKSYQSDISSIYLGSAKWDGTIEMIALECVTATWCSQNSKNWPNDDLKCHIDLGVHHPEIVLVHDSSSPITQNRVSELSEWHLKDVLIEASLKKKLLPKITEKEEDMIILDGNQMDNTDMIIRLSLKRNQIFHKNVFLPPLIAASLILLLSFCLEGSKRGALNLIAVLIILIAFLVLVRHAPAFNTPKLVYSYEMIIISSCFSYFLHIIILWLTKHPPLLKPGNLVMRVVNFSPFRFGLGIQYTDSVDYLHIQERPWQGIASILNRIVFIIYSLLIVWIFLKGY